VTELSEEELKAVVNAVQTDASERRTRTPQRPIREIDLTERSASAAASMETMNLIITGTLREHLLSFGDEAKGFEMIEMTGAEVQDSRVSLVSGGGVAFVFNVLGETSILSIDLVMARQLGRVLLGDRTPINESEIPPPLARSESRVLERAVKTFLIKLATALHINATFDVLKTEAIGPRLRLSLPTAPMWAIRFSHPETRGSICIAFPYELARRTLSEAKPISVPKDLPSRKRYQSMVLTTDVDVIAVLGKASIALDEWLALEVGEVLLLDRLATSPLDLLVNDAKKYECTPSVDTGKVAVEITRVVVEPTPNS
jgi:flagellar motor switch protein FliM